ncbi:uncharacterized protein LOC131430135 [Malaya genurostris]|uniref:uncharacterized protein LOC131430135 n=1 Tax=Malaya genurostris TaxID=325434 RepID=UPI0026F3CD28|nr:uncharacterized protein LOC131430135 [Malaya genurostris]XP_058450841.1 uncharacterized protein LOC131430135 [Malaya genurostris]
MDLFDVAFLQIILIVATVESGYCIECYNCDSTSNDDCSLLPKNSGITAEQCTPSKIPSPTGNWIADLTRIEYFGGTEITVPMVCQKVVATNENGETLTYRGCQLDGGKTDPCQIVHGKAKLQTGVIIEHCSICKSDECNGTMNLVRGRNSLILAATMMLLTMTLTKKILF